MPVPSPGGTPLSLSPHPCSRLSSMGSQCLHRRRWEPFLMSLTDLPHMSSAGYSVATSLGPWPFLVGILLVAPWCVIATHGCFSSGPSLFKDTWQSGFRVAEGGSLPHGSREAGKDGRSVSSGACCGDRTGVRSLGVEHGVFGIEGQGREGGAGLGRGRG